jgi:hypothetical protein
MYHNQEYTRRNLRQPQDIITANHNIKSTYIKNTTIHNMELCISEVTKNIKNKFQKFGTYVSDTNMILIHQVTLYECM